MLTPIVYSHWFWVDKTSRWMFTEISDSMPERVHRLFDYNIPTEDWVEAAPFVNQMMLLNFRIQDLLGMTGAQKVDLICHSQWSVAATLLSMAVRKNINRAIFVAPPRSLSEQRMNEAFGSRNWVLRYPNGQLMKVPRRDGSITTIPMDYWADFVNADLGKQYSDFCSMVPTSAIFAKDDEVLWNAEERLCPSTELEIVIPWNHDFTDQYRNWLIEKIKEILG